MQGSRNAESTPRPRPEPERPPRETTFTKPNEDPRYRGTLLTPGPEVAVWLASFGIALLFALIVEWLMLIAPVPLGGDTGTWTALSYPFIGYPHPSEIVPFGYPPLLFPLLGFFVQLGGGPLVGARIYLGFIIVLLGLSTFVLGRSLFRFRVTALIAEGLLFTTVPFDRLFFFGGYPTLLGLVFMNLAIAFAVRYVRGRRPAHALYFWLATAATLLSHEFVGLALVVALAAMMIFLFAKRQFPWSIIASRAGAVGATLAALSVGAFYLGVRFAHISQNNYLSTNALAHQRTIIAAVLYPIRIQAFGGVFGYQMIKTPFGSFVIALTVALTLFFGMLLVARLRPRYLTPSVIAIGSMVLAVVAMAVGGWILNIYTDYRRFAYALYLPYLLAGLLAFDTIFHWCSPPSVPVSPSTARPDAVPVRPSARGRRRRSTGGRTRALTPVVAVCGAVVVVVAGGAFTEPGLIGFQHQYTGPLHQWPYVHATEAISNSGIPGAVLSLSGGATLHWTFAMTDRNVYSPTIVSGFIFKQTRIIDDQLAVFPFHYWTAASNGLEFVAVPGNTSTFFTGSPVLGALRFGTPTPILSFPPDSFVVTLANGTVVPAYSVGGPLPAISLTAGSVPSVVIRYTTYAYILTVTSTSAPGGTTFVNATAVATGPSGIRELSDGIRQVAGVTIPPKVTVTANSFSWNVGFSAYKSLLTNGSVAAPGTVRYGTPSTRNPSSVNVRFAETSANTTTGSPSITLSVSMIVPGANSLGSSLPASLNSAAILQNWNVRFVLLNNITRSPERSEAFFFEQEFGATPLFLESPWEVLLLPQPIP
jgi:hypothetical protein